MLPVCCFISITRLATYIGWTSKPTPRSDTTRLSSNVFKVFGIDGVFLSAWTVMMFNTTEAGDDKALMTALATRVGYKPLVLAIFCTYPSVISAWFLQYAKNLTGFEMSSVSE